MEEVVHHGLESGQGIGESEKHHHWFKRSSIGLKSGLPLVTIADSNVFVAPLDVKLRKECQSATVHSCELIHKFAYEGEWSGVLGGESVKF